MNNNESTDSSTSIEASEFIWTSEEDTEVHRYVGAPIENLLRAHNARKIVDLGCGNGAFTHYLAVKEFDVTGLDFSTSAIKIARENYSSNGAKFAQHDLMDQLPPEHFEAYDAVVSVEVVEHLLLPRKLVQAARQALKPGGVFIMTTPYHGYLKNLALAITNKFDGHWHPLRDYGHVKFFSSDTIGKLLSESGFRDIQIIRVGRIPALARSMVVSAIKGD